MFNNIVIEGTIVAPAWAIFPIECIYMSQVTPNRGNNNHGNDEWDVSPALCYAHGECESGDL